MGLFSRKDADPLDPEMAAALHGLADKQGSSTERQLVRPKPRCTERSRRAQLLNLRAGRLGRTPGSHPWAPSPDSPRRQI